MDLQNNYILKNVTIINGTGKEPQTNMAITILDGIIDQIEAMKDLKTREEPIQEIDLKGKHILPGLIDAHVHLAGYHTDLVDQELGGLTEHKLVRAMRSVADARKFLEYGFTSVRDVSWNGLYLKRVFQEKTINGPRVIACGPGLVRRGGHGDLYQLPQKFVEENHFWGLFCDGPEEIRRGVRKLLREGADQIKIWTTGGGDHEIDRNTDLHYSMEEIEMAVEEARMFEGTMVMAHCESLESIRMAIEAGVDTIEHGECLDEDAAEAMAENGIILIPTLTLITTWYEEFQGKIELPEKTRSRPFVHRTSPLPESVHEEYKNNTIESFNLAREKGVKIGLGSDTVFEPTTPYGDYSSRELKMLVECGMSVMEAITAATKTSSEALGLDHKIGTIEEGKLADFLVVSKDPSENIDVLVNKDNIEWVVTDGQLVVSKGVVF